jgi:chromosome segregation ATPase
VPRKSLYPTYYGKHEYEETTHPDCPRTIGGRTADEYVWSKVCEILAQPDVLIGEAQKHVENLRQQWADSQAEKERLEKELEAALTERQWVITQARKGRIKDSDMDTQIASLDIQETEIKRELNSLKAAVELQALEDWEAQVREYLANLQAGVESLNTPPQNDEEAQQQYEDKRRIVQTLVERVQIGKDRELKVTFKLDVIAAIKQLANFCENWQVGICSRIPDLTNSGRVRVTL